MNLYDLLLDELISKSHTPLDREQVDQLVIQLASEANRSKVPLLLALRQTLHASGAFSYMEAVNQLQRFQGASEAELEQLQQDMLNLAGNTSYEENQESEHGM